MSYLNFVIDFARTHAKNVFVSLVTFALIIMVIAIDSLVDQTPFWVWLIVAVVLWGIFGYLEYTANKSMDIAESARVEETKQVNHPGGDSSSPIYDQTRYSYDDYDDLFSD